MMKTKSVLIAILLASTLSPTTWAGKNSNKYPMSFFSKARTAQTVGEGRLSLALKLQEYKADKFLDQYGDYCCMEPGTAYDRITSVFTAKYGWTKDHHIALGIPYIWIDYNDSGKKLDADGVGNVFIFEKWRIFKETDKIPAVALDAWYYFPTGDTDKKIGSDDDSVKFTAEFSKAYGDFSFHLNPGYIFNLHDGPDIQNHNAGIFWHLHPKWLPAVEYNFFDKEDKGRNHQLIPGMVWRFAKGCSLKLGVDFTVDSSTKYRDDHSFVTKLFKKF